MTSGLVFFVVMVDLTILTSRTREEATLECFMMPGRKGGILVHLYAIT